MDAADDTTGTNPLETAALQYAAWDCRVVPLHSPAPGGGCTCQQGTACKQPSKHPRTRHGVTDATTTPATIRQWWRKWPQANVGIATAGLVVVDVDGSEGAASLLDLGELPPSPTVATGRGRHYYFRDTRGTARNTQGGGLPPGIHIRATGGHVVAPPSKHHLGTTYRWVEGQSPEDVSLPPAPDWLYELITRQAAARETARSVAPPGGFPVDMPAVAQLLGRRPGGAKQISEGSRNDTLTSLAGSLRADGFELAALLQALLAINAAHCKPPLDAAEVERLAESVVTRYPAGPSGPIVRVTRPLLRHGLSPGAVALYGAQQALVQGGDLRPGQTALAAALGVSTRHLRRWVKELREADYEYYTWPQRDFARISTALLVDPAVSHQAKATALHLAANINRDTGTARVGLAALAKATRRVERTLRRDLQELQEAGYLGVEAARFHPGRRRREHCNTYWFRAKTPPKEGVATGAQADTGVP